MKIWVPLIIALIFQNSATLATMLYLATNSGVNQWLIHVAFIVLTSIDILVGYHFGKYVGRRFFRGTRFEGWLKKHSGFLRRPSRNLFLILTGVIDYPYLNGIIGSWLNVSFKLVFVTTLIGNSIYYLILWSFAMGAIHLNYNKFLSVAFLAFLAIVIIYSLEKFFEKESAP